jgi:hypothetical protein
MINYFEGIIGILNKYFQPLVSFLFYDLLELLNWLASQLNPSLNIAQNVMLKICEISLHLFGEVNVESFVDVGTELLVAQK